jgi:ferric-dicitrate binding protein FerR (iron transport regulator)
MSHCRIIVLCLLLVVVFGASLLPAQTGGAMLYANGNVKVNGQAAGDSTSIFPGDKVDVTESSSVSINRSGSSVVVSPNSSIKYDSSSVEIMSGTARVSTSKGMSAQAGQITVAPKTGVAKFDVLKLDDKVTVASREGALTVNEGGRTITLTPGSSATLLLTAAANKGSAPGQVSSTAVAQNSAGLLSQAPFSSAGLSRSSDGSLLQIICPPRPTCAVSVATVCPCHGPPHGPPFH